VVPEEDTAPTPELAEATDEPETLQETPAANDEDKKFKELQQALESAQLQHQEELHSYIERIDTLEAKLQYLARETTDSARKATLAAPVGSAEKKLSEKDQQIAQLMEEGKNLASTEHKQRVIMKKLRSKIAADEKELNSLRDSRDKTTKELEVQRSRARRADELEKANQDLQRRLDQSQKELGTLQLEVRSKDATISDLKRRLETATEQAEEMTAKVNNQAREQDRRRLAELEESVATLEVEKNLVADRAKAQVNELTQKAERAAERCRALELEMKAESQLMESKLEETRARAEEASSGATGDSQAKLLRQVETLQTQYSIATDNWQGIESTLLARIGGLEKERDEALRRESEMRRKAREAVRLTGVPSRLLYLPPLPPPYQYTDSS
jgi:DNA repair exonuclease SbcCD ATPase subunit